MESSTTSDQGHHKGKWQKQENFTYKRGDHKVEMKRQESIKKQHKNKKNMIQKKAKPWNGQYKYFLLEG